ncbi:MAG: CoA-binding protein [Promethearchaeota archaeon]
MTLDSLFKPKNVAIVYASEKVGYFIYGFKEMGFEMNNLYLINTSREELFGYKCYKSLNDVPVDTIDLIILSIRREGLIETLKDIFSKKKVNFIHIFTAGTGEADEKGEKIESEIKSLLEANNNATRIMGPNCMGIYCPTGGISYYPTFPKEEGIISLIFQSGDLHSKMIKFGSIRHRLRFTHGVSIGNCVDLQVSDFLEYFNNIDQTKIICVYIEGFSKLYPNEGKKLFNTLKNMKKPVLLIKGGKSSRAQTAAASHTGAIASNQRIWKAMFNQTSTIEVPSSLDDLIDYTYLFYSLLKRKEKDIYPKGKNVLVILWSGGFGILATDIITGLGLEMPIFEGKTLEKLKKIYPKIIGSLSNPLDLPWIVYTNEYLEIAKAAIAENIDLVIIESDAWRESDDDRFQGYYHNLLQIKKHIESLNKVLIITLPEYTSKSRSKFYNMLLEDDFIVFPNVERASKAFLALYEYGIKKSK